MNTPRQYTPAERYAAIRVALDVGPAVASRQLGLPRGTLSCWVQKCRLGKPGFTLPDLQDDPASSVEPESSSEPAAELSVEPATEPSQPSARTRARSKTARLYTPSEKAHALERAAAIGVTAASKELGISRFSLYEWRRKVRLAAEGKADSPTSGLEPADIEAQRDKEILDLWRQHPGLGPSQIRNQLRRKGIKIGVNTVRRVMEDAGYRPPKVKRDAHQERYEAVRPNHLWHLDFVQRYINRTSTFTLILIDDHSRFVVGHGVDDAERAVMVLQTFAEAVERHGKPEAVMHDKGSAFWSWKGISRFTALLVELGIDQIVAEHKEWNGKVEVFN
ncbi:MAG: hypothetical protein EA397_19710, partial [Deltaproteobacteria bacterium]